MRRLLPLLVSTTMLTAACTNTPATESTSPSAGIAQTTTAPNRPTTTSDTNTTTTSVSEPATLVVTGGPIITMNPARPIVDALAVRGNMVMAVGRVNEIDQLVGPETQVIDLEGRAAVPGFVDAHVHYYLAAGIGPDLESIQDFILSLGTTTVGEMSMTPDMLEALQLLDGEGRIQVRTSVYLSHNTSCGELLDPWILDVPPSREWGEKFRIGGVKIFTDGGACNVPASSYARANGGMGDLYLTAPEVAEVVTSYDQAGYQVALHALGDRAVEATLDGLELAIGDSGNPRRHRIEHNASVRPDLRSRYDEVGAVALTFGSLGTCFLLGKDDRFQFAMPIEYQEWEWPWRDLLDLNPNTVFAWHGDYPVFEDSSPIANLAGYVTRRQVLEDGTVCEPEPYHLKHAITVEEALWIMTMGSAYALDRETEVGSLELGKLADLVILSADPTAIPPEDLFDINIEMTILDGDPVYCGMAYVELCGDPRVEDDVAASSALPTNPASFAIDGDSMTHWGAGDFPPQWIEISLGSEMSVAGVRMTVSQAPPGFTRHLILGRLANGELVRLAEMAGDTAEFDVLEALVDPPKPVVAIRVETLESPSWVSWFEIEVVVAEG